MQICCVLASLQYSIKEKSWLCKALIAKFYRMKKVTQNFVAHKLLGQQMHCLVNIYHALLWDFIYCLNIVAKFSPNQQYFFSLRLFPNEISDAFTTNLIYLLSSRGKWQSILVKIINNLQEVFHYHNFSLISKLFLH